MRVFFGDFFFWFVYVQFSFVFDYRDLFIVVFFKGGLCIITKFSFINFIIVGILKYVSGGYVVNGAYDDNVISGSFGIYVFSLGCVVIFQLWNSGGGVGLEGFVVFVDRLGWFFRCILRLRGQFVFCKTYVIVDGFFGVRFLSGILIKSKDFLV